MASDDEFRQRVRDSWPSVWALGRYLHAQGDVEVRIMPLRFCKPGEGDKYDLVLIDPMGIETRMEVKGRSFNFTCAADFPYQTIYIDRVSKGELTSHAYYQVSKDLKYACRLNASDSHFWRQKDDHDNVRGHPIRVWDCSKNLAMFYRIAEEVVDN